MSLYTDSESAQIRITATFTVLVSTDLIGNTIVVLVIILNRDMRYFNCFDVNVINIWWWHLFLVQKFSRQGALSIRTKILVLISGNKLARFTHSPPRIFGWGVGISEIWQLLVFSGIIPRKLSYHLLLFWTFPFPFHFLHFLIVIQFYRNSTLFVFRSKLDVLLMA